MTLSNFDWTDKTSVRWFLILPTGHEGPYSLEQLVKRKIHPHTKIWSEGISFPVNFEYALGQSNPVIEDELPPPLPPLPDEDEVLEVVEEHEEIEDYAPSRKKTTKYLLPFFVLGFLILGVAFYEWTQRQEHFSVRRAQGMSVETHQRIQSENQFSGWDKKLFLKEYVSSDLSNIWLVTSSYQSCDLEAEFVSEDNKLLSESEQKVHFKTQSKLVDHLATFDAFKFESGTKVIPGLYKMNLRASHCEWTSFLAKLMNGFSSPDKTYEAEQTVVLYHKGSAEFNAVLDKLLRRKLEASVKSQNQEDLFWQDLQQKLQTLQAVVLQIEQLFLDFSTVRQMDYPTSLKIMVNKYTKNFGSFLTDFVVANEKYFMEIDDSGLKDLSKKRTYEKLVNMTAKDLGFEAMKLIEELQQKKSMNLAERKVMEKKIRDSFSNVKKMIGSKIIQVTEDRANLESPEPLDSGQ